MGSVDVFPDGSVELGYPLTSVAVGAATRWQALSDANDATYVKEETGTPGVDIIGLADVVVPAGAVITGGELRIRYSHTTGMALASFSVHAPPKDPSPFSPDVFAFASTALGNDVGKWYYTSAADSVIRDIVVPFNNTFQYNTGVGYSHPIWNWMDFTNFRVLYAWDRYPGATGNNRLYRLFVRVYYDMPPTVSGVQPADLSAGQTFTTTPSITWTFADTEGKPQTQYHVKVILSGTLDAAGRSVGTAGFNPETAASVAYDSGVVAGANNQATVGPKGLTNLSNYYAYVKVWHAPVSNEEMASAWTASSVFQVNGTAPSTGTLSITSDGTNGRNLLEWQQGSWTATPYPNYVDFRKILDAVNFTDEYVRNGVNVDTMSFLRTGSDANNEIDTPHVAALAITGNLDLKICFALEGAVPANGHTLLSKWDAVNGTAWDFVLLSTNQLRFRWWNGASLQTATSTALTLPTAKTPIWVRVKHFVASNWHSDFYYSNQSSDTVPHLIVWNNLSSHVGVGSGTMTSVNSEVSINRSTTPEASIFRVYYVEIRNSSDVIVANPDFRGAPLGSTTVTDSTGKVWTIRRSGTTQNFPMIQLYDYEEDLATARFYTAQAISMQSGSPVAAATTIGFASGITATFPYLWWFKVPLDPTLNRQYQILPEGWDAHRPADAAAFSPLGRSNKVVVSDGVKGAEQTMKVEVFSQSEYDALLAAYKSQQVLFVQTTGQKRYLSILDWKDDRGTLANGYSVVTLDVVEVDKPLVT